MEWNVLEILLLNIFENQNVVFVVDIVVFVSRRNFAKMVLKDHSIVEAIF